MESESGAERARVKWCEFRIIDFWLPALRITSQVCFPPRVSAGCVGLRSSVVLYAWIEACHAE